MITNFQKKVYKILKRVPKGKVTTYKKIAKKLQTSSRAVGNALNKNPFVPYVPCHRVIKSDGSLGGYGSGTKKTIEILRKEGVEFAKNLKIKNFRKILEKL